MTKILIWKFRILRFHVRAILLLGLSLFLYRQIVITRSSQKVLITMASIKSFTYSASPSFHNEKEVIPIEIARSLDAILVLGGGVPSTISTPPAYVKTRCDAAAKVALSVLSQSKSSGDEERAGNMMPAILCLSAGTAHLPQLLSIDGLPVWESTASAAYILDKYPRIPASKVFAETTSYDTISNAFFSRTSFTDIVGWKKLLIVTNEVR
jgi:uncharacterized SAM-binding protein YcdF (DUF218 family)